MAEYRKGAEVLDEVFEFIRQRAAELHPADPVRGALTRALVHANAVGPGTSGLEECWARRGRWQQLPRVERAHRILNVLGDRRLLIREIAEALEAANPECDVSYSAIAPLVRELLLLGDLARVKEPRAPGSSATRWRYYRNVSMASDLRALQRAFDEAS